MREIKFRGLGYKQDSKSPTKEWFFGNLIKKNKPTESEKVFWCYMIHDCALTSNTVIPETVGQYTGINDKNGKEIYEGDIVKSDGDGRFTISWNDNGVIGKGNVLHPGFTTHGWDSHQLVVLGNIHDNPELK